MLDEEEFFICVLILTLVGALSTSALSAKRQLKNYAVYYICGLKWKQCATVNFWSSVIEFGICQFLGCLVIMAVYVLLSLIRPLNIIGNNTPNQVLKSN